MTVRMTRLGLLGVAGMGLAFGGVVEASAQTVEMPAWARGKKRKRVRMLGVSCEVCAGA